MATNQVSLLTFFEETVGQGIGPNGTTGGTVSSSAQWLAAEAGGTAFQMPHLGSSLDPSGVQKTTVTPEQVSSRVFETQARDVGLSNVALPFSSYLTGSGVTLAAGSTAAATSLSRMLDHALGGVHYTETVTLESGPHTTTVVTVDDASTLALGAIIAWVDADGNAHPRVITAISGVDITLDTALPATPVDTDICLGGATLYVDEDVLVDSSGTLGSTLSGLLQKGSNGSAGWELNGLKLALTSIVFARNEYPSLEFNGQGARFTDPVSGPSTTFPAATFPTPAVIGPDTQVMVSNTGTTTIGLVCNGSATIDPGVPVISLPCMADSLGDMEGLSLYSTEPANTIVDLDLFPRTDSYFTDYNNGQNKKVSISRLGPSGACFSVHMQNCEVFEVAAGSDQFQSSVLKFRAVEVNPATATTALERSKIRLFIG